MISPRMTSITVNDFRSIKGEWTIGLDAPVVLVHGLNGAGKTSLLSAIELAATGRVAHLERAGNDDYARHLQHRGQAGGRVSLKVGGLDAVVPSEGVSFSADGLAGRGLLSPSLASFFSERSFLSQTALGRLLEIYAPQDGTKTESSLIRFVKELLGLDDLDDLIQGLSATGHITRAQKLSRSWEAALGEETSLRKEKKRLLGEVTSAKTLVESCVENLEIVLGMADSDLSVEALLERARGETEAADSGRLEVTTLRTLALRLDAAAEAVAGVAYSRVESNRAPPFPSVTELENALADWWQTAGQSLLVQMNSIRGGALALPLAIEEDGLTLFAETLDAAQAQLARAEQRRDDEESLDAQIKAIRVNILHSQEELDALRRRKNQLDISDDSRQLGEALALMLPHVLDDQCPLCDQKFQGAPHWSLGEHIKAKLEGLSTQATQLLALNQATNHYEASLDKQLTTLRNLKADPRSLAFPADLTRQIHDWHEAVAQLAALMPRVDAAETLLAELLDARKSAAVANREDIELAQFASQLELIAQDLGATPFDGALHERAAALRSEISAALRSATDVAARRDRVGLDLQSYARAIGEFERQTLLFDGVAAHVEAVSASLKEAGRRKDVASALRLDAERIRSSVISEVFDQQFNDSWRKMFSRLVPAEPFIPQFKKQTQRSRVTNVELETIHRDGLPGASPGAMLSFGNVNTAALSLFLTLHFSVPATLPWLIFDDPVQSMDDFHVANFAAMVRQLSRTHGRQIIIAVHERELFDYLSLELTPASPDQELLTVTLQRADGETTISQERIRFEQDHALEAPAVA